MRESTAFGMERAMSGLARGIENHVPVPHWFTGTQAYAEQKRPKFLYRNEIVLRLLPVRDSCARIVGCRFTPFST